LELSIDLGKEICNCVSKVLKKPHDFEYEKVFYPLCLLGKKKYSSIKFENDPKKGKRNDMGNPLVRRDYAGIVKDIYGGVMNIILYEKDIKKAIKHLNISLEELIGGNIAMDKLVITKSLRSSYKNPKGVAHKVLADRIGEREPGNKPTSGDRIPYVYIVVNETKKKGVKMLQGDKIETPTFIKEKGLKIDYAFYITNQIMKPLLQLLRLLVDDICVMKHSRALIPKYKAEVVEVNKDTDATEKKKEAKVHKIKEKVVKTLIFDRYLTECKNAKEKNKTMDMFFSKI